MLKRLHCLLSEDSRLAKGNGNLLGHFLALQESADYKKFLLILFGN